MCGILGTFNLPAFDVSAGLERIRHRGPDGDGIASAGPAVHGHVRLALLDLTSASSQPFKRDGGVLSFNGEIWNYRWLRSELESLGEQFVTTGDTEVLAAALCRWGVEETLPRLEGMFAFAWSRGDVHVLATDRFGKIPLHVCRTADGFVWSSEIKGLGLDYPSRPLGPGALLELPTGRVVRWYDLPAGWVQADRHALMSGLRSGVAARLVSDAPLCCLISGGLDSSLVLAEAVRLKPDVVAYTAVLDPGSPDLAAARRLCAELNVRLVEVPVKPPTAESLSAAVRAIELPSKAQVEIAALCIPLARAIAADGFKACLSGEAADELFGGYGNMCIAGSKADDGAWRAIRVAALNKMAHGNFIRCNKAFMAHGVECRLPFMERQLVETVIRMSKRACPPGKKALKTAAAGTVPAWVIKRPKETFQGASGMLDAAAGAVANPQRFYAAEYARRFGRALP